MPHLLVAGTTGSGKSVGVNAMILSILFKSGPEDARLIMIDPKMLELSIYEGIPHLLCPVVTDMKEAANALRWSVAEMERRYKLMSKMGVRNLAGFNRKVKDAEEAGTPLHDPLYKRESMDDEPPYLKTLPTIVVMFPMAIIFFVSALAETNRPPFDLPEAESELVAGYFSEYSAMTFALFFLGEYANMILMSAMTSILFLGGWLPPVDIAPFNWIPGPIWFAVKIALVLFVFLWVRATFPRYRYDQLMRLGWKVFLPFSLFWVVLTAGVLVAFDWLP